MKTEADPVFEILWDFNMGRRKMFSISVRLLLWMYSSSSEYGSRARISYLGDETWGNWKDGQICSDSELLRRAVAQILNKRKVSFSISGRVLGNFQVIDSFWPHSVALESNQSLNKNGHEGTSLGIRWGRLNFWRPSCAESRSKNESPGFHHPYK